MANRYSRLIENIFKVRYKPNQLEIEFKREDLTQTAIELSINLPKNLGDVIYSFRYRSDLPDSIKVTSKEGFEWIIRPDGDGRYKFCQVPLTNIAPNKNLFVTKILDSTPGIIEKYSMSDEQALLAKLRYNRLIDIFLGLACYSMQNHLRTKVRGVGQIEVDEVYLAVGRKGEQYIIPVQAKGGNDRHSVVQIEQDMQFCGERFKDLICRPIAAQFVSGNRIALMELAIQDQNIALVSEEHYQLVSPSEISPEELEQMKRRVKN